MFSSEDYQTAWMFYCLGVACCMVAWWLMTRWVNLLDVRVLLRVLMAVLLLMPWFTQGSEGFLSPAIVIMFIEGLFERGGTFARAGMPLLTSMLIAAILVILFFAIKRLFFVRKPALCEPEASGDKALGV